MVISDRMKIINCMKDTYHEDIKRDVEEGLSAPQKSIPCKYFYDDRGSRLFEAICRLPEYYQTRTELSILQKTAPLIMDEFEKGSLIELGSGANWKIRRLLDEVAEPRLGRTRYMPVDVSETALVEAARELLRDYSDLSVVGVIADFTKQIDEITADRDKFYIFFGSTIGNFNEEESSSFLQNIAESIGPGERFLLGLDMVKPVEILEAAYNDSQGITAQFNKNILRVMNSELGADFNTDHFDHLAFYNGEKQQVELHLQANQDVAVNIEELDMTFEMDRGETIHTEICRKFTEAGANSMAAQAGLAIKQWYTDAREWFSLVEMTPLQSF